AIKPVWIAGSALAVCASYVMHIESWRQVLHGWGQRITFGTAARTWSLANLGRYVPGKVWSVAGLVVLAQRAGVQVAPAAASAFVSQALAVGTGAAVVAAVTPHATSPLRLAAAGVAALATVGVLTWAPTARWLGRLAGREPGVTGLVDRNGGDSRPGHAPAAAPSTGIHQCAIVNRWRQRRRTSRAVPLSWPRRRSPSGQLSCRCRCSAGCGSRTGGVISTTLATRFTPGARNGSGAWATCRCGTPRCLGACRSLQATGTLSTPRGCCASSSRSRRRET